MLLYAPGAVQSKLSSPCSTFNMPLMGFKLDKPLDIGDMIGVPAIAAKGELLPLFAAAAAAAATSMPGGAMPPACQLLILLAMRAAAPCWPGISIDTADMLLLRPEAALP